MTLVSELELPELRLHRPAVVRGSAFTKRCASCAREGWLASGPFGYIVLDREAGGVLAAHARGDLSGDEDRGDLRRARGAAV